MATAKKNSSALYKCTIVSPDGQISTKCEILKVDTGISVKIRFKKPRSSKYAIRNIPWSRIVAYSGKPGSKDGFISYISQKVPVIRPFKGSVDVDEKTGMYIVTSDEDITYIVRPECLDAMADEADDSPSEKVKSKKK